jgi:hypothetical protein
VFAPRAVLLICVEWAFARAVEFVAVPVCDRATLVESVADRQTEFFWTRFPRLAQSGDADYVAIESLSTFGAVIQRAFPVVEFLAMSCVHRLFFADWHVL